MRIATPPPADTEIAHGRGPLFWLSAAAGWALVIWGLRGVLHHHRDTRPAELARFFVGGAVIHDALLAPVVIAIGVVVARLVRGRWRAPVQVGLLISGSLALFSYAEVRDYARVLHNPSSLPRDYAADLGIVLAAVWVVVGIVAALSALRARRQP